MYKYKEAISYDSKSNNQLEILEQLNNISKKGYEVIRLFGSIEMSEVILNIINEHKIPLKVFLGIQFLPELIDQEAHPSKVLKTKDVILNKKENQKNIEFLINLASKHEKIVQFISVGYKNIASYDGHIISRVELNKYIKMVKQKVEQKVTYTDSFYLWNTDLKDMTSMVDFISVNIHPYPQGKFNKDASDYLYLVYEATKENLTNMPIVISETGYPNLDHYGNSIKGEQQKYIKTVQTWAKSNDVLVVLYEAYDNTNIESTYLQHHGIL